MQSRLPLVCLALATVALAAAGTAGRAETPAAARASTTAADASAATPAPRTARVDAVGVQARTPTFVDTSDPLTWSACTAPSVLRLHGADDARDLASLATCGPDDAWAELVDRDQPLAQQCSAAGRPVSVARALEGALPLDAATEAHVRAVFRAGQALGRRRDAVGLVGDSMTADGNFLRPFAAGHGLLVLPADVRAELPLDRLSPASWLAPRAAKVGARAPWALAPRPLEGPSPVDEMIAGQSPAYAVVLYGANDALWRTDSVDLLVRGFDGALSAIVDVLEARGVVPILTTIPKHMREKGWPDCAPTPTGGANERFAVQATILSAEVAELACRRHLPLVDLRWALDPLVNHGIGPDGVHLSVHPSGGGVFDASGLGCGHNVQNLVTMRELGRVLDATTW